MTEAPLHSQPAIPAGVSTPASRRTSDRQGVQRAAVLLACVLGALFVLTTVAGAVLNYSPVPFWDMWPGYLTFYTQVTDGIYRAWIAQHTEHRLVVGNLFFWADLAWFGGSGRLLAAMNVLMLAALASMVAWSAVSEVADREQGRLSAYVLASATTAICFSWMQQENINWGFQTSFFVSLVVPLAAFLVLRQAATSSWPLLLCALLLGVLSSGTMANGLAVLPTMAVALLLMRRFAWAAAFAAVGAVVVVLYFVGYRTPELNSSLSHSLTTQPGQVVRYTLTFIGGIFGHVQGGPPHQPIAEFAGAVGLAVLVSVLVLAYRRAGVTAWVSGSLLFLGYVLASAVATAAGRVNFGLDQAMSSRYLTYSLVFWALLLAAAYREAQGRTVGRWLVAGVAVSIAIALIPAQLTSLNSADEKNLNKLAAALAFELGARDAKQIEAIFPWMDVGFVLAERPRERNLSIFGDPRLRDLREQIGKPAALSPGECFAGLDQPVRITGEAQFARVSGWIGRADGGDAGPDSVALVDAQGNYAGFAVVGSSRTRHRVNSSTEVLARPFKGYVKIGAGSLTMLGRGPDCTVVGTRLGR